jgi:hypothetical protein
MDCIHCDGTGYVEEYGEFRMKCDCVDGKRICVRCGDFAARLNGKGEEVCTPHYYEWEQEEAA